MPSKFLTLRQAAERLGVHHTTLKRWILDDEGPPAFIKQRGYPNGRPTIRIPAEAFERWIRQHTKGRAG